MNWNALWFPPSRVVWFPSAQYWSDNKQINIAWLKWKIQIFW